MVEYNTDIHIADKRKGPYGPIYDFLKSTRIERRFDLEEEIARKNKIRYQQGSIIALILVGVGITSSSFLVLIGTSGAEEVTLRFLTLATIAGSCVQLLVWLFKFKRKWLVARYAAERIRSVKALLIAKAALVPPESLNKQTADDFITLRFNEIDQAVNQGWEALSITSPRELIKLDDNDQDLLFPHFDIVRQAYAHYRVEYQKAFAQGEATRLESRAKEFHGVGSALLLILAVLAATLTSISFLGIASNLATSQQALMFWSLSLFTLSALWTAQTRTSLAEPNLARYKRYKKDIEELMTTASNDPASFRLHVKKMERLAIGELEEFTDDAKQLGARII